MKSIGKSISQWKCFILSSEHETTIEIFYVTDKLSRYYELMTKQTRIFKHVLSICICELANSATIVR